MSVNLLRNSKVFFTTNIEVQDPNRGVIKTTGHLPSTTYEIQVLDDLSFSQTTAVETIGVNETGNAPVRGQRTFNTSLNPVDFSFSTYMRPAQVGSTGSITVLTPSYGGTAMIAWNVASPPSQSALNTTTAAIASDYGPNTQVICAAPAGANVRAAVLYPVFGTDPLLTATYNKVVGFGIADGGKGYSTGGTLTATVFDPDSGAEATAITFAITAASTGTPTTITCEENVLWNAMFSPDQAGTPSSNMINTRPTGVGAWKDSTAGGSDPATLILANSNSHQLQRFGLIVVFDQNTFLLHDCSLNTATIDFGIDAIATIQWSGQARRVVRIDTPSGFAAATTSGGTGTIGTTGVVTNQLQGTFRGKLFDSPFIANKLSTITLATKIGSEGSSPNYLGTINADVDVKQYTMPLTGGSITLTNNITYLTPAYMGAINQPIAYFTGSRSITGSLTAYLRTGAATNNTNRYSANLFSDLIAQVNSDSDPEFFLQIEIGGINNSTKVLLQMPAAVLTIPTVNAESVITTTVNFTAQGHDSGKFDIIKDNEIVIKYFA